MALDAMRTDSSPFMNSSDTGITPNILQKSGNHTKAVFAKLWNTTFFQNGGIVNATESPEVFQWSMTLNFLMMGFLMVTGILGNVLIVAVYLQNRRKRQSTANYFLCSLAIVDLIVCLIAIPVHLHLEYSAFNRPIFALECALFAYIWHVVMFGSAWMLVGISIDRYYCLCRPFILRTQARHVTRTILIIWASTVIISIPTSFFYDDQCQRLKFITRSARLGIALAESLVSLIIPLLIITIAYAKIFWVISKRNNETYNASHRQKIMHNTRYIVAKRLLLVIGAFVLCWLPRMIAEIYTASLEGEQTQITQTLYICQTIVPYFNSILNPILYSLINPKFRHGCRRILLSCFGYFVPMPAAAAKYTCRSSSALYH
ncbi:melatonin receptor type 1A-A-like [Asterias amurensis]|uniref:melatonin receptor type 1A-A-like n=1 Tax=Asterias amurensis TaxID=7602 RepID=UPI003AB44744